VGERVRKRERERWREQKKGIDKGNVIGIDPQGKR